MSEVKIVSADYFMPFCNLSSQECRESRGVLANVCDPVIHVKEIFGTR